MEMPNDLKLKPRLGTPQRRVGLTRYYPHTPLLKLINVPARISRDIMPPKTFSRKAEGGTKKAPVKAEPEIEKPFDRPPDSSSDDEDNDIKRTKFIPKSSQTNDTNSTDGGKKTKSIANGKGWTDGKGGYKGTAGLRSARRSATPSSSASRSSPKRKSQEDAPRIGAGMMDEVGRPKGKKARSTYGASSQSRLASSQPKGVKAKSNRKEDSPLPDFQRPGSIPNSPIAGSSPRKSFNLPQLDGTPDSTPKSNKKYKKYTITPMKEEKEQPTVFQSFDMSDISDIDESFSQPSTDPTNKLPPARQDPEKESAGLPPSTQNRKFVSYDLDSSLLDTAEDIIGKSKDQLSAPTYDEDLDLTMTQRGRCPMCNADVDPTELRKYGTMNIRMQEKFCRAHRAKSAKDTWEEEGYPEIKWDKLDARISKHHTLIKEFIEGKDSYYRQQMEEKVNAGKDRSLRKMTTNLTPGYYGARGLRAISENIMQQFTRLLKKRMVEDNLMSARGFTPYVQSVLVPEVASRLIMKDMKVTLERAREILTESIEVGELLNEEVRDVVTRTVDDSEEETDED